MTASLREKELVTPQIVADLQDTRARLNAALLENETFVAERRNYINQISAEDSSEKKALDTELKKVVQDLTRIRQTRDALQKQVELQALAEKKEIKHIEEIKILAKAREDRIKCLEQDLIRIKMGYCSEIPEASLLKFFIDTPNGNPYSVMKEEISSANIEIADLKALLGEKNDTVQLLK